MPEDWGTRTVLLVHGLGSNKGNALVMARNLVPAGFNVLSIDLRAHGESGGQLTGIGSTEYRDVLGALAWLKASRPEEAQQVFGLGASQGAAALLRAAADPRGAELEAVAVLGTFADLSSLMTSISQEKFPGPLGVLLRRIGFPLAELHAGAPLRDFAPAAAVRELWPRPVLIIHGTKDEIIPVNQSHLLFNAAALPKDVLWLEGSHNSILASDPAAAAVLQFFRHATPLPVL